MAIEKGSDSHSLCWIRRDIRLNDHAALALSTSQSTRVAVVFVFDELILKHLPRSDRRVSFIHRSLQELDGKLRVMGSKLVVLQGDPVEEIPRLAHKLDVTSVHAARDYEPYAQTRDHEIEDNLRRIGVGFSLTKDHVIREPEDVTTGDGRPFRVFTPYRNAWNRVFQPEADAACHAFDPSKLWSEGELPSHDLPDLTKLGFQPVELWLEPGEKAATERMKRFSRRIADYKTSRDVPSADGTSTLSTDLRFGTVSIREAFRISKQIAGEGSESWRTELIWREFYQHILFHNPRVVVVPFQHHLRDMSYPGSEEHFQKWCKGETGYPIVDAAMRCLNQTGWMHNRLRMIVASFLTKDLLVDYRKGEKYFADNLLDFELASNNGGWQWSASTGADSQPYFRIFNPYLQSAKFDPEGLFIKKWVPELIGMAVPALFSPSTASTFELLASGIELGRNYPYPIVDHAVQKPKAISLLSEGRP